MSYLAKTEIIHLSTATILFAIFAYLFGPLVASSSFFGAFLIDADHMFDFAIYLLQNKKPFSLETFFKADFFKGVKKLYLPLHSWELSLTLMALYFFVFQPIFLVLGFSVFTHLAVDQLTNNVLPTAYFLTFRVARDFSKGIVCKS